jgi:hypothetical protein
LHPRSQAATTRVLFIGNSLTAANDLPALVDAIGRAHGTPMPHETIAVPNFSLDDHWDRGDAVRAIARGGWSTIVLQQGPSALAESRVLLRASVRKFDGAARRAGARTALYMVWPTAARGDDFPRVHESYAVAAHDVGALLLPAGDAWRAAWRREPSLALYGPDGFHPTFLGSYVAALAIYAQLANQLPGAIGPIPSAPFPNLRLEASQASTIAAAVTEAVSNAR